MAKSSNPIEESIRAGTSFRRLAPSADPVIDSKTGTATFIFNTEDVGRDGHIVRNAGIRTKNFESNPVILFGHNDREPPIGRATVINIADPASTVEIEFTPRDLYPFGATIGDMVKARFLNACSESWQPIKWHFMKDRSGVIFDEVDLLEISIVPIPALPDAVATARASGIDTGPLVEWAERLLDSGGIATMPRGELETLRRAAKMPASTNPRTANPDDDDQRQERTVKNKRALVRNGAPLFKRGLYDAGRLCFLLEELGYAHFSAAFEAELEGDGSGVPQMLKDILDALGKVVIEMTSEEVSEFLAAHGQSDDDEDDDDVEARALSVTDKAFIAEAKTPGTRALRRGIAISRAGKSLSNSNQKKLKEADGHQDRAMKHHRTMADQHEQLGGHIDAAQEHHERMTETLSEVGEHVRAAQDSSDPKPHLEAAERSYRAAEKHAESTADAHAKADEAHEDAGDTHRSMGRSIKRAQGCVRSVLSGAVTSEADEPGADDTKSSEAAKEEAARAARARRAAERAKKYRQPIALTQLTD